MTVRAAVGALVAVLLGLVGLHLFAVSGRTIYRGGPIVTMDAEQRVVEALGIDGDRIAVVGSETDVLAWGGRWARVLDLHGHALLPGFVDAHSHFPGAGLFAVVEDLHPPPMGDVASIDDVVARMRRRASTTGGRSWVVGMGYDDTLLAEGRHPTREDLDRVSTERPLATLHISGHLAAVNSRGLAVLGYDACTPDGVGGRIRRDPTTGEPDGVLEERAIEPLTALLAPGPLDALRIVREGSRRYLAAGVTTAQNGNATMQQIRSLAWASRLGVVPLRLVLWPDVEAIDAVLDGRAPFPVTDEEWVRIGAVKLVADGSIQGYTANLTAPYHVPPAADPAYRGYPRIPRDELSARIARYHAQGLQVAVHGNGDAAIDDILDAVEHAQQAHPRPDARPIVVHALMARPDQLDRMQRLGIVPSFFVLHTYYWGDRHRDRFLGPERAARISPVA
ncbi:MAG: amidohydrolase, partial [Candidatus Binatia bacterium]